MSKTLIYMCGYLGEISHMVLKKKLKEAMEDV